jgi:mono/diheme cytochrome c family protein
MRRLNIHLLGFLAVVVSFAIIGCNGGKNQPNIEIVQNMMDQENIKSQDWDPRDGDKVQMRMPPAGTVPRGFTPYPYPNDPEAAAKMVNPLASDTSVETMEKGKKYFNIYCSVCHGFEGKGDGTVSVKMPVKPPPLISDKVKDYKDGRIFHIMTVGQGVMGNYATQITDPKNRWAVVNYVRSLQRKSTAQGK